MPEKNVRATPQWVKSNKPQMWGDTLVLCNDIYNHKDQRLGTTVCVKRNAHLIPIFFVPPLGEGGQKLTWSIMQMGVLFTQLTMCIFGPLPKGGHKKNSGLNVRFFWLRLYGHDPVCEWEPILQSVELERECDISECTIIFTPYFSNMLHVIVFYLQCCNVVIQ